MLVSVVMMVVSVVVVDMLDCSVDTYHYSVDTAELFHAYFFYVIIEINNVIMKIKWRGRGR